MLNTLEILDFICKERVSSDQAHSHESVEAALQKAFPKPAAAAKRALAKYISVVESMLFDALQRGQTPEQRKLGL